MIEMPTTLKDLAAENTLVMVGTVCRLLTLIEREVPELKGTLADEYRAKALSGDYANACEVTEEYALKYLATSLHAREGDLTGDGSEEFDRAGDPEVCDHCGTRTTPRQERECDECTDRILGNL